MKNKINFISGEIYSLSEIFSGERKIIIPDLQRDYCWGDAIHTEEKKELVSGFVNNLFRDFEDKTDVPARGLIYGYEAPENHIQLCDGQQRITTIYLLIGMLNRKLGDNSLQRHLITDFEYEQDNREPYLLYSIRESSLYFMSDLVCHFFIKEEGDRNHVEQVDDLEKCSWFFNEYKEDPSILSMIKALGVIDKCLADKDSDWCRAFGDFLMHKVTFMYYDLENRPNGEETFVVINTTGEPLSAVQNLKPLVLVENINKAYKSKKGLPADWEEIETWFWKNRIANNGNDTADAGFKEFLRWVTLLNINDKTAFENPLTKGVYAFPYDDIPFSEIKSHWENVVFLFERWEKRACLERDFLSPGINKDNGQRALSQADCFILLPLMAYCRAFKVTDPADRGLLRLYKFLENLKRIGNVIKSIRELVFDAIQVGRKKDLVDLLQTGSGISSTILTKEENLKLSILKAAQNRDEIEEAFWRAQDFDVTPSHRIWSGEILPLLEWSMDDKQAFDLDRFNMYLKRFDSVFEGECGDNIDDVRRALLALGLPGYPRIFSGNTNHSFAWYWSDWQVLINANTKFFKDFFDKLERGESYRDMISACPSSKWFVFVRNEFLLKYCQNKIIQNWRAEGRGWVLIQKTKATKGNYISVRNMILFKFLERWCKEHPQSGWAVSRSEDCVEVRKDRCRVKISDEKPSRWIMERFEENASEAKSKLVISGDYSAVFCALLRALPWLKHPAPRRIPAHTPRRSVRAMRKG